MLPLIGLQITSALLEQNCQEKPTEVAWVEHLAAAQSAIRDLVQQLQAHEHSLVPNSTASSREVDSKQAGNLIQLAQAVLSAICAVRKAVQKAFLGSFRSGGRAQITKAHLPHAHYFS